MEWLNYHHLLYFWTVAREGGISKAAEKLRLSQPTISAQVRLLEDSLGQKLFQRQGRSLVMTDVGRVVYRYADEIFGIGRELMETLRGRPAGRPLQLAIGVANAVPKLIAYRLLRDQLQEGEFGLFLGTAHPAKFKESVEEILGQPLPLPEALAARADLPLLSHAMKADFAALRAFLLK